MPTQPVVDVPKNQRFMRLQRVLSPLETWGFGLTAHIAWFGIAPALHAALGPGAIFVWLPGVCVGMLLNLQVKRLGTHFPDIAGGTPNYTTRLLKWYPGLGRYAALGYFFSWTSTLPINAIILTELIKVNIEPLGITCPDRLLKIGFTLLPFIVAFSGTRALSILHLFLVIPSIGLLLAFCFQGLGWLAFSPASPGFFPTDGSSLSLVDWAKWFFFSTYAVYACESASAFVADSRHPAKTLGFLTISSWLMPPVFLGGSWVLMRLATDSSLGDNAFLNLVAASKPFWGQSAASIVTFSLAAGCLLSCATVVANCPRILYQLALDGHVSPVFGMISRRGVLGPALVLTLFLSLICLAWGDVPRIVILGNTGWFVSIMSVHLGLWLRRGYTGVSFSEWAIAFFLVEAVILVVGGLAWGWLDFIIGLLCPIAILAVDVAMRRLAFAPFHPAWWNEFYRTRRPNQEPDFVAFQVIVLSLIVCSAVASGWVFGIRLNANSSVGSNLLVVLLLSVTFIAVAIACWTSLPQVAAIVEAREAAEHLFTIALDAILVLDENGVIRSSNPAAVQMFAVNVDQLNGQRLNEILPGLAEQPEHWLSRSEQIVTKAYRPDLSIVEVAISARFNQELQEYVVILRDISERKLAEKTLQESEEQFRSLVANTPGAIYRCRCDSNWTMEFISDAIAEISGYSASDFINNQIRAFISIIHPEDTAMVEKAVLNSVEEKQPYIIEYRIIRADGNVRWVYEKGRSIFDRDGSIRCLDGALFDITERQQIEAKLRQTMQLKEELATAATAQANQLEKALQNLQKTQAQLIQTEKMSSLGQLVAGVAHEINNPVNFIYGNLTHTFNYSKDLLSLIDLYHQYYPQPESEIAERIAEIDLDFLSEDLPKILSSMQVGADRIRQIVLTLRNFSRVDEAQMKSVNIHEGIDSTLMILQHRLKARAERPGIQVIKEYGDLPLVECYAGQMNQVFMNILSNAVDALYQRDKLRSLEQIKTHPSTITIRTQVDCDRLKISIKDNGSGIADSVKARLFDPFFTTKPVGEGTGLGLSISYQIVVNKHGGQLTCISEPGQGADFWIEIPIRQNGSLEFKQLTQEGANTNFIKSCITYDPP